MSDNSRIAKNTIFLYIRMILVMCISLYTSRVILDNLGVSDYGLYNVVGSITTMLLFINGAMASATQRFLTIEIANGYVEKIKKVFNISLVIHILIALLIILLCEIGGLWFIYNKMVIPEGREIAVFWTFQISLIALFFGIINVPFNAAIIAREKMGVFAYISIFEVLFQLFIAYVISVIPFDRLIVYSILLALCQIFVILIYWIYCVRNFPECGFKLYRYENHYKEMLTFASWILLSHFTVIINTSIQNMMLNVFFSPVINAARGIAIRVAGAVTRFNDNFQLAVSPQIVKSVAQKDRERMNFLIFNSSKYSFYLVWLLSFPIMICMDDILHLWLVEVPEKTNVFLQLILINGLIETLANPLNKAIGANGVIKYAETGGSLLGILVLPISYISLKMGFPPESVFIIMICFTVIGHIMRLGFSKYYLKISLIDYFLEVIVKPVFVISISAVIPLIIKHFYYCDNKLMNLIFIGGSAFLTVILCVFMIGLGNSERIYIFNTVKSKIKK